MKTLVLYDLLVLKQKHDPCQWRIQNFQEGTPTRGGTNLITVRNEVAKVMFLHLSVCPQGGSASVHAGIPPPGADSPGTRPPKEKTPPGADPPADGYGCGRYASYWNAFLYLS